eukprot:10079014-Alexandrium_andersonii.AAC.1
MTIRALPILSTAVPHLVAAWTLRRAPRSRTLVATFILTPPWAPPLASHGLPSSRSAIDYDALVHLRLSSRPRPRGSKWQ